MRITSLYLGHTEAYTHVLDCKFYFEIFGEYPECKVLHAECRLQRQVVHGALELQGFFKYGS